MHFEILSNELVVHVDAAIYNIDVLHKCFYWYGATFNVDIEKTGDSFLIKLTSKSEPDMEVNLNVITEKIRRDLIDFKLRDIVTKETQTIRELIVAKAFAYYELDDNPSSDVSDPVGFTPQNIQA